MREYARRDRHYKVVIEEEKTNSFDPGTKKSIRILVTKFYIANEMDSVWDAAIKYLEDESDQGRIVSIEETNVVEILIS